jgi:trigger factor
MDISISDLGGWRRELAVVVPASEVDAELEKAYEGVRGQVALPGFRAGKVPRALIEKKFGAQLKEDVANEIVGKAVEQALKDHALELVSQPEIETPPAPPESGQDLKFSFRVEVKPTFELPEYKGISVQKTVQPVKDEDVAGIIENLRFRKGVLKPVPEGSGFAAGDWALCDLVAKAGDEVIKEMKDVPVGGEHIAVRGFQIDGLAAGIQGKKAGDQLELDGIVAMDVHDHDHDADHDHDHDHEHAHDEHEGHEHAHETKPVRVALTLKELKRRELPEVDDAFAQEVGEETVLGMRVAIRKKLTAARERAAEKDVEQKFLDVLVDRASFEMAQGPVDRALESRIRSLMVDRMIKGESEEAARAAIEAQKGEIRKVVERDAKAWLIVEKLAKKEKIFALEDDVSKEIAMIAEEQGSTPTKIRESLESEGMLAEIRANVLERKVLGFLRSVGTVTEAPADGDAAAGLQSRKEEGV